MTVHDDPAGRPRIFGIGLNKTGTSSLHTAFEMLGLRSLHWGGRETSRLFWRALREDVPLLTYVDPAYDAFTDTPITRHFKLADRQYPGSKFILTTRDLDAWLDSRRRHAEKNQERKAAGLYDGKVLEVDIPAWRAEYASHHEDVLGYFEGRPDDLLVYDITAGGSWEPLCRFLGRPVPAESFPWANRFEPMR